MGTNYYARIIPKAEDIKELKTYIDLNSFTSIKLKVDKLYDTFKPYSMNDIPSGVIHLGKRSAGWKFLWNPNIYLIRNGHSEWIDMGDGTRKGKWIVEPNTAYYIYPLTKEGIKSFIDREDIEIYDEYDEKQDKEEFWKMATEWITWTNPITGETREAWDSNSYDEYESKNNPSYTSYSCKGEYTYLLESQGFKITSRNYSDFYSDGLRFATNTDFC